jgi:ankyrin repeat protein
MTWRRTAAAAIAGALAAVALALGILLPALAAERSALADAAMQRDVAAVRALVREGADPNALGTYDTPALVWIVRIGDRETADVLLSAGADPNLATPLELAPLHLAVTNGDSRMVELLLAAGANPDQPDRTGETPLMLAARVGTVEIVQALLAAGADVDAKEPSFMQTALHVAVREGSEETAALLLEHGADVAAATLSGDVPGFRLPGDNAGSKGVGIIRGGWPEHGMRYAVPGAKTPLLYATRRGDLAMVRLLVEAGADIEQADANGITPLLNAIINASVAAAGRFGEHFAVAHYLIDAGADVDTVDWYGETPLWAAVDARNLDVTGPARDNGIDREAALALIERLLDAGAEVNARTREYPPERRFITPLGSLSWVDFTGQTPFLRAALAGDTTVMQRLLEHGANPNIGTFAGTTPLMAAAGINWVVNQTFDEGPNALLAAVKLAHGVGNDVDAVNSMGLRAIHGAANRGSNEIIRYLAANGAALDAADNEGRTPIAWAEGVFLATHPPVRKPETIALLELLLAEATLRKANALAAN